MTTRLKSRRSEEIKRLRTSYKAAVRRLVAYRQQNPAVNVLDFGYYLDGSWRESVNDTGGFSRPSQHLWEVGEVDGHTIYICEDIDFDVWTANNYTDDPESMDLGTYQLAMSNPNVTMYHNQGMYIGVIKASEFQKVDWSLDTIITVTDLLHAFGHKADMTKRIKAFTKQYAHSAASV